jgi:hypothetical protein
VLDKRLLKSLDEVIIKVFGSGVVMAVGVLVAMWTGS